MPGRHGASANVHATERISTARGPVFVVWSCAVAAVQWLLCSCGQLQAGSRYFVGLNNGAQGGDAVLIIRQCRRAALESGLSHKELKRKAPDDTQSAFAAAADGPKLKGGRFDLLGNVSSDDSSGSA